MKKRPLSDWMTLAMRQEKNPTQKESKKAKRAKAGKRKKKPLSLAKKLKQLRRKHKA